MLEAKQNAGEVELCFRGPSSKRAAAVKAMRALGFTDDLGEAGYAPWREAFSHIPDAQLPGMALRGAREK